MAMAEAMSDCTEQMLELVGPHRIVGEIDDVVAEMMALTQAIIVRTMFSTDLGATAAIVNRTWPIINRRIGGNVLVDETGDVCRCRRIGGSARAA